MTTRPELHVGVEDSRYIEFSHRPAVTYHLDWYETMCPSRRSVSSVEATLFSINFDDT